MTAPELGRKTAKISKKPPASTGASIAIGLPPLLAIVGIVGAAVMLLRPTATPALPAPGLAAPADDEGIRGKGYGVTLAVLAPVYDAFAKTDEAKIYDGPASMAAGNLDLTNNAAALDLLFALDIALANLRFHWARRLILIVAAASVMVLPVLTRSLLPRATPLLLGTPGSRLDLVMAGPISPKT